ISSNKRGNVMGVCVLSASYTPLRLLKMIGEHDDVGSRDDHTAVGETLGFPSVAEGKNTRWPAPKFLALISTAPDGCLGRSLSSVQKKSPAEYARGSLDGDVFGLGCGAPRLTSLINAPCFASFLLPLRQRVQGTPTSFPEARRDLARRAVPSLRNA